MATTEALKLSAITRTSHQSRVGRGTATIDLALPASLRSVDRPRRIAEDTLSTDFGRRPCRQYHLNRFATKAGEKSGLAGLRRPAGPLVLVVMDGVGLGTPDEGNAVHLARTGTLDGLISRFPHIRLRAHGKAVGLPKEKDMGNSEVGHNALGAGRVFDQGAKLVNMALNSGTAWQSSVWKGIVARCLAGGTFHLIGLLSDGNVHSHMDHIIALLDRAHEEGIARVRLHILLDGRDVPETSALQYVRSLEKKLRSLSSEGNADYRIASGGGRMVTTMDRYEADWRIVARGWKAHVRGEGRAFDTAEAAIETYRVEEPGISDQFLPPFVVTEGGKPVGQIVDGDAVLFFNFRGDRAIEISRAFEEATFDKFPRGRRPDVLYAGMMEYDGDLHIPKQYLVSPPAIDRTMTQYLVGAGVRQLAIAETQKFGHITYFWNGNRSGKFDENLETYVEIPSDRVPFEQRPWMKAAEVTDEVIRGIRGGSYPFIRVNYANGDMVGHTGILDAAILAVEAVDLCVRRVWNEIRKAEGVLIITADHGNADEMFQKDKKGRFMRNAAGEPLPLTSHTLNPVLFLMADERENPGYALRQVEGAGLSNVAATVLNLLGYEKPEDYDESLICGMG